MTAPTAPPSGDPSIRFGERRIEQAALTDRAARAAQALHEAGVGQGDRVAIVMRNDPELPMLSAAAALLGAVPVPANWHWQGEELRHVLGHSGSRVAFVHSDLVPRGEAVLPAGATLVEVPVPEELAAAYGSAAPTGRHPPIKDWLGGHEPYAEPGAGAPLSLIYTSGTTGLAEGVLRDRMSPEHSTNIGAATLDAMGLRPGMSSIVTAPMYHAAPNAQALFAVALGIDLTIMPRFDAEKLLRLIERHRIAHAQVVPTMFVRLLELPEAVRDRYDRGSLEAVVHAAAPCPVHVKRRMIDWLGPVVLEYYGSSETGVVVKCDTAEWLAHRPPRFFPGFTYLDMEDERRAIDRDGYVTLGDVGRVDGDGFLYLSDRARDMVISGGVNIYPIEIEACLLELRGGVRDAAVFGVPDEIYGEAVAAHVEVDPGAGLAEDAIRDHVRGRLAGYKVPRVVVFDDDLPREDTGKIFKRRIRERYWRDAGRSI